VGPVEAGKPASQRKSVDPDSRAGDREPVRAAAADAGGRILAPPAGWRRGRDWPLGPDLGSGALAPSPSARPRP